MLYTLNTETGEIFYNKDVDNTDTIRIDNKEYNNKTKKVEKLNGLYVVYHNKGKFYAQNSYNMNEIIKVYNDKIKTTETGDWF